MDQQILNSTITIESVEQKDNRVSILAHDKNRYSFWATRKAKDNEGNPVLDTNNQPVLEESSPMAQFRNMGLRKGSTVRIGYVIEPYTDKMGKNREAKKIINFQETNDQPTQTPLKTQTGRSGANIASGGIPAPDNGSIMVLKDESFWERQAYEKCCSLWASHGTIDQALDALNRGRFWDLFQAIKADGAKRFSATPNSVANLEPELPVIQQEELPVIQVCAICGTEGATVNDGHECIPF